MFRSVTVLLAVIATALGQSVLNVTVDTTSSPYRTDRRFLSITLNGIIFHRAYPLGFFDVYSPSVKNMAKALAPASVRIGGVRAGLMFYQDENGTVPLHGCSVPKWETLFGKDFTDQSVSSWGGNWNVTAAEWSVVMDFIQEAGWDVTFNINQFVYNDEGVWDPTNIRKLLEYSESKGYKIEAFQLTNEPNSHDTKFNIDVSPEKTVLDFQALRNYLDTDLSIYMGAGIIGPDITSLAFLKGAKNFIRDFIVAGGDQTVDALTMHQYYFSGPDAVLSQYLDEYNFDSMKRSIDKMRWVQETYGGADLPIIISETGDSWSGGAKNLSNGFVASLMFLDQLGTCAKNGVVRINRQDFHSGYYGLMDERSLLPNPNFFLSVLYKQLIEGPVLTVAVEPADTKLRVYAHCARRDVHKFRKGAIVVYYININNAELELDLSQYSQNKAYLLYQLTSINGVEEDALKTNQMLLNGQLLELNGDEVPSMEPVGQYGGNVVVAPYSLGFVVINSAKVKLC